MTGHPPWCERRHLDTWPVHTRYLGDIHTAGRVVSVQLVDYGNGNGPVVALGQHDDENTTILDLSPDAAGAVGLLIGVGLRILRETR